MGSGLAEAAAAASAVVAASVAADAAVVVAVLPRQVVATEYACKSPGCRIKEWCVQRLISKGYANSWIPNPFQYARAIS